MHILHRPIKKTSNLKTCVLCTISLEGINNILASKSAAHYQNLFQAVSYIHKLTCVLLLAEEVEHS